MLQTLPTSSVDYTKVQSWMCKDGRGLRTKPLYPVLHREKSLVPKLKSDRMGGGKNSLFATRLWLEIHVICTRWISLGTLIS